MLKVEDADQKVCIASFVRVDAKVVLYDFDILYVELLAAVPITEVIEQIGKRRENIGSLFYLI